MKAVKTLPTSIKENSSPRVLQENRKEVNGVQEGGQQCPTPDLDDGRWQMSSHECVY